MQQDSDKDQGKDLEANLILFGYDAFRRGERIGRAAPAAAMLAAITATAALVTMPLWVLLCLGAIGASVLVMGIDDQVEINEEREKRCQDKIRKAALSSPSLKQTKPSFFNQGLKNSLLASWVKSLVAVFAAPIILVGLPVNKGLRGYWFFPDRTNNSTAEDYSMDAPEGKWTGRLDGAKWGLSSHLSCLFTDIATQKKYRLRVFNQAAYKPSEGGPAFDGERAGGTYEITTRKNKNGLAVFLAAQKLS